MAILLIRHGETPGNRDRIIQFPDTPLSDRGLAQAERLGRRLASERIAEIWVSDHARAHMTAEAVGRTTGAPLRVDAELAERNLGALRGRRYADLDFDPFAPDYAPPEGESWSTFHARVDRVWERIERHWLERFAAVGDVWVWDSSERIVDELRRLPDDRDSLQTVTLLAAVDGLVLDVVTSRATGGTHTRQSSVAYEVRGGELVPTMPTASPSGEERR